MDSTPNHSSSFEEILNVVNSLVNSKRGKSLSKPEIVLIRGAWNEEGYKQMADNSNYTVNYLQRNLAPKLFEDLTNILGSEINKNNLKTIFKILINEYRNDDNYFLNKVRGSLPPDISKFYGRTAEVSHLRDLVCNNRCVSLVGVAGIGKSALVAKLMADFMLEENSPFDCFIWKIVSDGVILRDLVAELLSLIDPIHNFSNLPDNTHAIISLLIEFLQRKKCLIVLDDFSISFENNDDYRYLLRRLVEEQHQSCVVLTSRQMQDIIKELIQAKRPIDFFKVEGLDPSAAIQILLERGLSDEEKCYELIEKYRGNPSELEAVAHRIHNLFGSEQTFFQNPTTLISTKFSSMLDEMFAKQLTEFQKRVLTYIAQKTTNESGSGIKLTKLLTDLKKNMKLASTSEIINAIEKLEQFSLIEKNQKNQSPPEETSFTIQPIIKKYIKTNFVALTGG